MSYDTETWRTKANADVNVHICEIYFMAYVICLFCSSFYSSTRNNCNDVLFKHWAIKCKNATSLFYRHRKTKTTSSKLPFPKGRNSLCGIFFTIVAWKWLKKKDQFFSDQSNHFSFKNFKQILSPDINPRYPRRRNKTKIYLLGNKENNVSKESLRTASRPWNQHERDESAQCG